MLDKVDPARSMRLLWGLQPPPARGPKQSLTVDDVVLAAIEIADRDGLEALSMRRVADHLGVAAMSLYTYVRAKSELLDLMFDRVAGESDRQFAEGATWREKLEAIARADWELRHRHRWIQQVPWPRAPLGPNILDAYEAGMAAVSGLGLSGKEMTEVLTLVSSYVAGAARYALESVTVAIESGVSDTEWWTAIGPLLERIWDPERFPTLSSPEMAGAWDQPDEDESYFLVEAVASFEFGLARVLDGTEAFIEQRAGA